MILVAPTDTEIHTNNWIDRTSDLMMMMKNGGSTTPIFGFSLRQGLVPRYGNNGVLWSR
uniref:Uncharacterized protein n=1 Tax=Amphimedon queenslandica TaxID=400682 RepID=A0A1X7VXE3_AMPQE